MQINNKDVFWNFSATVLKIASGVLILPLILRFLSTQEVGIWTIFLSLSAISYLLDFGFSQTFTRNITYIFSGVNELQKEGYERISSKNEINYGLLKSTIDAMRWFYKYIAIIVFIFLILGGTTYLYFILKNGFTGNSQLIFASWIIYSITISYQIYTLYYDALLQGRGLIKIAKQITVISQISFIVIGSILIIFTNWGLLSLVIGQTFSIIINRVLSKKHFFDLNLKYKLSEALSLSRKETLENISPNAIKIGITSLGGYLVNRSSIFIGSIYIPLADIASFGITKQIIDLLACIATLWFSTYYPQMIQHRVQNNDYGIKNLYIKSKIIYFVIFIVGGIFLVGIGNPMLEIIESKTLFIPNYLFIFAIIVSLLENNHSWAGSILLTKNEVPFFKAALYSGLLTVILLFVFLNATNMGILSFVLAPGIAQLCYQNWKWPIVVNKEFDIKINDYKIVVKKMMRLI